uniref:Uncharacterized protein n=1 Tax=Meloidogyne hapla TaxID=6305 RepID=A0A1I8BR79_MELHA
MSKTKLHKVNFVEAHKILNLIKEEIDMRKYQKTSGIQTVEQSRSDHTSSSQQIVHFNGIRNEINNFIKLVDNILGKVKVYNDKDSHQESDENEMLSEVNKFVRDLNYFKNSNAKFFDHFEWNIELKTQCQKCLKIVLFLRKISENFDFKEEMPEIDIESGNNLPDVSPTFTKFNTECLESLKDVLNKQIENKYKLSKNKFKMYFKAMESVNPFLVILDKMDKKKLKKNEGNLKEFYKKLSNVIEKMENVNPIKYLFNTMDEPVTKIVNSIKKIIKLKNPGVLNKMKKILLPKLETYEKIKEDIIKKSEQISSTVRDQMNPLIEEAIEEFRNKLVDKKNFLLKNAEELYSFKEDNENVLYGQTTKVFDKQIFYKSSAPFYVGYCLVNRILNSFTKDGKIKVSEFLTNGLELAEAFGEKVLDLGYYKTIQMEIESEINKECKEFKEEKIKNECKMFQEHKLHDWKSFCSIDTEHVEFERFDEMTILRFGHREAIRENSLEEKGKSVEEKEKDVEEGASSSFNDVRLEIYENE